MNAVMKDVKIWLGRMEVRFLEERERVETAWPLVCWFFFLICFMLCLLYAGFEVDGVLGVILCAICLFKFLFFIEMFIVSMYGAAKDNKCICIYYGLTSICDLMIGTLFI